MRLLALKAVKKMSMYIVYRRAGECESYSSFSDKVQPIRPWMLLNLTLGESFNSDCSIEKKITWANTNV